LPNLIPEWIEDDRRRLHCPTCRIERDFEFLLRIDSLISPFRQLTFATCTACTNIIQLDFAEPSYENEETDPASLKFYIEQGAGLDSVILPPVIINRNFPDIKTYLEIGCGFVFSLDFASRVYGMDVKGIDPSPLAREGSRLLGVPIENRYLALDDGIRANDAIVALEVIEHINKPKEFLRILRNKLSNNGIIILSTPDAAYIEKGKNKEGLIRVLSPGWHCIIYSRRSLEMALLDAGFKEVKITSRGANLWAAAGPGASKLDLETLCDRNLYASYLAARFEASQSGSMLEIGFGYRLFKHLVCCPDYKRAIPVFQRIAAAVLERDGIDISDPYSIVRFFNQKYTFQLLAEKFPICLPGLLFFSGIHQLNCLHNRDHALAFFFAAYVAGATFNRTMREAGLGDGETAQLEELSIHHISLVSGQLNPKQPDEWVNPAFRLSWKTRLAAKIRVLLSGLPP
jgi:SAM-dependent methyltransferase